MSEPIVKFEVKPTSVSGQSILVLPDPGYHTPQLSLWMRTDLAKRLAHAANTLPDVIEFVRFISSLRKTGSGWIVTGDKVFRDESKRVVIIEDVAEKAKALLARAEEVKTE